MERQLGPIRARLDREPDIVVRFVDRLESGPLSLVGVGEAGYDDDSFVLLRSRRKEPARVRVDLCELGGRIELVCERGLSAVPLLIPILNVTVLARGALPLHASAFVHEGRGVVATGWSKGGKTETLLAFMARGARFVGDEWVYLTADGRRAYGIAEPVRLWDWHLRELPQHRRALPRAARARLAAVRAADGLGRPLSARARQLIQSQLHVDLAPSRLFGSDAIALGGDVQRLLLVTSHEQPDVTVEPVDPAVVASRMAASLAHERERLESYYRMYRFAFPGRVSEFFERAAEVEREALGRALAGLPAWEVRHPYPVRIAALYEAVAPLV